MHLLEPALGNEGMVGKSRPMRQWDQQVQINDGLDRGKKDKEVLKK